MDVETLEPAVAAIRNAGSLFVGRWAPESAGDYATGANHVLPTGGLARASGALAVEQFGKFIQVQRITAMASPRSPPRSARSPTAEGLHAHRAAVDVRFERSRRSGHSMSPTPVSIAFRPRPAGYTWEATDEAVAEKYGVPVDAVVRFDLNTSPAAPELVGRVLAAGKFEMPLREYPPSDYRRLSRQRRTCTACSATRWSSGPERTRSST